MQLSASSCYTAHSPQVEIPRHGVSPADANTHGHCVWTWSFPTPMVEFLPRSADRLSHALGSHHQTGGLPTCSKGVWPMDNVMASQCTSRMPSFRRPHQSTEAKHVLLSAANRPENGATTKLAQTSKYPCTHCNLSTPLPPLCLPFARPLFVSTSSGQPSSSSHVLDCDGVVMHMFHGLVQSVYAVLLSRCQERVSEF